MIEHKILLTLIILAVVPILDLLFLPIITSGDASLYRNPKSRHLVYKRFKTRSKKDIYKIFLEQNIWETKLILLGYVLGIIVTFLVLRWIWI